MYSSLNCVQEILSSGLKIKDNKRKNLTEKWENKAWTDNSEKYRWHWPLDLWNKYSFSFAIWEMHLK